MWRIKRRRTKPIENKAKTGVIYPKFNATSKPNRYVNRNTYLDVKCNRDKGAGCTIVGCQCSTDASGNTYCCKTTPYRNPILGYRKHLLDCSGNTDTSGCRYTNDVSGNVYKDNYAKSCGDPSNSLVCYNPVIKRTQNRNGCVNESYNYSTNQYLTRRCLTFPQQEFNFQSQVPVDASGGTKFMSCANCQYNSSGACDCSSNGFCIGINKLPCEVKNTKCFAIYKRSNSKFNKQGAVSGGSRINRLKYQTRVVAAQRRKVNGGNNVINGRGPAALYTTSRPLTLRDTTCVNPPPGPVDLSGVDLSPFTLTINWSIANITELCRIAPSTGFTLQRTGSSFGHTVTLGSGARTYTYTGIVTGSYNVRIKSDSYYGSSDWTYLNNIIVNFDPPAKIISFSDVTNSLEYQSRANTINDISSAAFLCAPGATPCLGGVTWYSVVTPLAYEGVYSGPWNLRFSIYLPTEYNHISITYNNPHGGTVFIFIGGSGSGAPPDENPGGGQAVSLITATTPTTPSTTTYGQSYQAGDYLKIQEHNSVITTALVITLTLY